MPMDVTCARSRTPVLLLQIVLLFTKFIHPLLFVLLRSLIKDLRLHIRADRTHAAGSLAAVQHAILIIYFLLPALDEVLNVLLSCATLGDYLLARAVAVSAGDRFIDLTWSWTNWINGMHAG